MPVDPILWSENVVDAHLLARRLSERACPITRSKLSLLFRNGGKIEMALPIYASTAVVLQCQGGLNELQATAQQGSWYTVRDRLRNHVGAYGERPRWEHVIEVRQCIDACIQHAHLPPADFRAWFDREVQQRWKVCLVTQAEDVQLGARDYQHPWAAYEAAEIQVHEVRAHQLPPAQAAP